MEEGMATPIDEEKPKTKNPKDQEPKT